MNILLEQIKGYLSMAPLGGTTMSEEIIEEFGEACKNSLRSHFHNKEQREPTIRISAIGRPTCQLQMEHAGAPKDPAGYNNTMKFFMGDLLEAAVFAIMKGAGLNIEETQTKVQYSQDGVTVDGTLDVVIDGKVYDVKTASKYSFQQKFGDANAFHNMLTDDPFGYLTQGYMYAEARGLPFGGWIVLNKDNGEWLILEPPTVDGKYRKAALSRAHDNIDTLVTGKAFKRCFEPVPETWYRKPTGNTVLPITCEWCDYVSKCWEGQAVLADNPKSKSGNKKWYIGEPK